MKVRFSTLTGVATADFPAVLCLIALLQFVLVLSGCGAPGAPLPPSLELPRPVQDLSATRKGDKVTLKWTVPVQTTDGQNLRAKDLGPAQVCRAIATFPMLYCAQLAGEIPADQVTLAKAGEAPKTLVFNDTFSQQLENDHPTEFATYAVAMLNSHGRSGGLSNQVRVPLAPVLPPPSDVKAKVTPEGVNILFPCFGDRTPSPLSHDWQIYRREEGTNSAVMVGEISADRPVPTGASVVVSTRDCQYLDASIEWDKTYYYHVTPVTTVTEQGVNIAKIEGEDSPAVKVVTADVFPPAPPTGLEAVSSGVGQKPFVDLTWAPDTAPDLAGYNVYRHEQGQAPVKINSKLVPTPSFRDENVEPGRTYYYSVSAVDVRGNESQRSAETSEKVPVF